MKKMTLAVLAAALFAANAFAMQINVNLANDIIANKDAINLAFDVYYNTSNSTDTRIYDQHMKVDGVPAEHAHEVLNGLNSIFAGANPVDGMHGEKSQFTFGYIKKDGTSVTPATCQNIIARPVLNIELSEAGCIVS